MSERPAGSVHLADGLRDEIIAAAKRAYPGEACGLLVGSASKTGIEVVRIEATPNRAAHPDRYSIDPLDRLAVEKAARQENLEVVGVWHSHPDRPPEPSHTDLDEAWQGLSYVIVSIGPEGAARIRSWRLMAATFHEETIVSRGSGGP